MVCMNEKKTIAFVIGSLSSGGAERVVSTLSNELIKTYKVFIITFVATPPFYPLDDQIKVVPCTNNITPSQNILQSLRTNFFLLKRIHILLKQNKIDLVIGFLTTPNILSIIAAKWQRIPVIVSERNNPYCEDEQLSRFWRILRRITFPYANNVVVQTNLIKGYYEKFIVSKKLKIVPNPINPSFISYNEDIRENIILNVGRLTKQKDQHLLIRVFASLNPEGWRLVIVGEGPLRNTLERLITSLKMEDKIVLVGQSSNIAEHYKKSKIFAFTSKFEGFPNALMEAMHFGLACISTDCPSGPSELIKNEANGFLIPLNETQLFESQLHRLVLDESLRKKISLAAREEVQKYYIKEIADKWNKMILASLN